MSDCEKSQKMINNAQKVQKRHRAAPARQSTSTEWEGIRNYRDRNFISLKAPETSNYISLHAFATRPSKRAR